MAGERQEIAALTIAARGHRHHHPSPPPSFFHLRQTEPPSSVTQKAISVLPDPAAPALTEWGRGGREPRQGKKREGTGKRADRGIFLGALYIFIYLFWGQRLKFEGGQGETGGATAQCWRCKWRSPVIYWQMKQKEVWPPLTRGFDSETDGRSSCHQISQFWARKRGEVMVPTDRTYSVFEWQTRNESIQWVDSGFSCRLTGEKV